jgi:hypothetical protein
MQLNTVFLSGLDVSNGSVDDEEIDGTGRNIFSLATLETN